MKKIGKKLIAGISVITAITSMGMTTVAAATDISIWSSDYHYDKYFIPRIESYFGEGGEGADLDLNVDWQSYGGDYVEALDIALQSGESPDIFKSNKISQHADAGYIVPLTDLPGGQELVDRFKSYGAVSEGLGTVNGEVYAVCHRVLSYGYAYNVDIFKENGIDHFPETYDELREVANKITENGNGTVYGFIMPLGYANYPRSVVEPLASASSGVAHFDHTNGVFDFSSNAPYFEMLAGMYEDGSLFPGFETMDHPTMMANFAAGNIAIIPVMSSNITSLQTDYEIKDFDWEVTEKVPVADASVRYREQSRPNEFYCVSSKAVEEGKGEAIIETINCLMDDEFLASLVQAETDIVTSPDAMAMVDMDSMSKQFKAMADTTYRYNGFGDPATNVEIEGDSYKDVYDKIILGLVGVEEGLADLDTRYNEALDKAIESGKLTRENYIVENFADVIALD